MQRQKKRVRVGFVARALLGVCVVTALVTDVIDPWIVPFVERPYGIYRAEFVHDVERVSALGWLAGSLSLDPKTFDFSGWVRGR